MATEPTNELLAQDIKYIKDDIKDIKKKLDEKFVSHESFDLWANTIEERVSRDEKVLFFLLGPIYAAVVTLLFKIFTG